MKLQIYLDTSVISAAFDERNPERKALTEEFFAQANKFDVYVSEITLVEIEKTTLEDLREKMKTLVKPFSVLEISDDVQGLTDEFIRLVTTIKGYKPIDILAPAELI